jgi:hypothetical protein
MANDIIAVRDRAVAPEGGQAEDAECDRGYA